MGCLCPHVNRCSMVPAIAFLLASVNISIGSFSLYAVRTGAVIAVALRAFHALFSAGPQCHFTLGLVSRVRGAAISEYWGIPSL